MPTNTKGAAATHGLGAAQAIRLKSLVTKWQVRSTASAYESVPRAAAAGAQLTKTRKSRSKKPKQATT